MARGDTDGDRWSEGDDDGVGRRRFQRLSVRCGCWLEHDDATVFGTTADIGLGGLFLRTAAQFQPGARVEVRLSLVGVRTPIVAAGTVAWSHQAAPGGRSGVGVQFTTIAHGHEALKKFLGS